MPKKYIVVFKNITNGFMDLEVINYLAALFTKNKTLKDKITFCLDNDVSHDSNQAIMQMYNSLIGFDIFELAHSNQQLLEYKPLNQLQLRKGLTAKNMDLNSYLNEKYKNYETKIYTIENNIYQNLLSIIEEVL